MSRLKNAYRLLALAGVLTAIAWGCSTDSPTAPRQTPAPPPTGAPTSLRVTISANPPAIVVDDELNSGNESSTIKVRVVDRTTGNPLPDGTLVEVSTSQGSFSLSAFVQSVGVALANGEAFLTLFGGGPPTPLGVATVGANLRGTRATVQVPIDILVADFFTNNPEDNFSVRFHDDSRGNPTRFRWDFGDGTGNSLQNPIHIFEGPGTYVVQFTVSKTVAGVEFSDRTTMNITISEPPVEEPPP